MSQGIIIAGGKGTRLRPETLVVNKHLLLVYDKPMIYYALQTLKQMNTKDVLIITNKDFLSEFSKLLGSGKDFGINLFYRVQDKSAGISDALRLAEGFVKVNKFPVLLGDNIFLNNAALADEFKAFKQSDYDAFLFVKKVNDPERFGIVEFDKNNKPVKIVEKPKKPKSRLAVTGLYMYNQEVFKLISKLKPSKRGELEITDLNNLLIKKGNIKIVKIKGYWKDVGTFDSLLECSIEVRKSEKRKKN